MDFLLNDAKKIYKKLHTPALNILPVYHKFTHKSALVLDKMCRAIIL